MNITIHRTPESKSILVQVTNRGYNERLFVNGNLISTELFSMGLEDVLTAEKHSSRSFYTDLAGDEVLDMVKVRKDLYERFGITIVYNDEEPLEVSSQPNGVALLNQYLQENFVYKTAPVIEPSEINVTENVAKDLGEFIVPLTNASGIPEVALYTYNGWTLRSSYFAKALEIITKHKGIVSSQYPKSDWSIFFYVCQGDKLNSIAAVKAAQSAYIGSEEQVLARRKADREIYENKLQDLQALFTPEGTNKVIRSHLADLVGIQNKLAELSVMSKSYKDWQNLRAAFGNILDWIRKG